MSIKLYLLADTVVSNDQTHSVKLVGISIISSDIGQLVQKVDIKKYSYTNTG